MKSFRGYERPDGTAGARNHVIVLPTVSCANGVVAAIAREVPQVVPVYHGHGCGRGGHDLGIHFRVLEGLATNPNAGAVLLVGLGCEVIKAEFISGPIVATGKPVEVLEIQAAGGSQRAAARGADLARKLVETTARQERSEISIDRLVLGLKCGGSDSLSGVTANPAIGDVADMVIDAGGTAIFTEDTEMIGTAGILARRARDEEVAARIIETVEAAENRTVEIMGPLASFVIAPGNMEGGMSTIREKALGCIAKAGTSDISQVVDYAEPPTGKGLVLMAGPGYDAESMTGLAAGGVQAMLFTTGRGNPIGYPLVPVMKIASNTKLFESMNDDMDVDAQALMEGGTLKAAGEEIAGLLSRVLSGEPTKAELNRQDGIACFYTTHCAF